MMSAAVFGDLLAAHFRYERANIAARRFISRSVDSGLPRSAVVAFLRNRRDPLPPEEIERCADEAIERWLRSRANHYRALPSCAAPPMSLSQITRRLGIATDPANRQKDDYYLTPPRGDARAPFRREVRRPDMGTLLWGRQYLHGSLRGRFFEVVSTDLVERGYGKPRVDFLMEWQPLAPNIVTDPPYRLVEPFIRAGLRLMTGKMALLLPDAFRDRVVALVRASHPEDRDVAP